MNHTTLSHKHLFRIFGTLCLALCLTLGGCKSGGKSVRSNHRTASQTTVHISTKGMNRVCREACDWIGTPYCYAGSEKGVGTDCSGMVMKIYEQVEGCKLPRNSAKQAEFCMPIRRREVRPGDLVFFATGKDPDRISHVGIMIDDAQFVHASSSKGVVVSNVDAPYYVRTFKMYGRIPR